MIDKPFFSIVIPTLNEEHYLPNLLDDLANQSNAHFEVIVVDGHSTDKTVLLAESFAKKLDIHVLRVSKQNVSFQRNYGGKHARGEWVIFMDADDRLPTYFLDGIKYHIAKYQDFSVFTTWIDVDSTDPIDKSTARLMNFGLEAYHTILKKPSALGAMIGVTKDALRDHQFDEDQLIFEDSFFVQELVNGGYQFRIIKDPKFVFSLRRLKKEGTLKMVSTVAITQLRFLQGGSFENDDHGYAMKGGGYYDQPNPPLFKKSSGFFSERITKSTRTGKKIGEYFEKI